MTSPHQFKFTPLALCGLLAWAGPAVAQTLTPAQALLTDPWMINLGVFVHNSDLEASLNGRSTVNPSVDFDETFGRANDSTRVRADLLWRITPAHHLRLMYFNNSTERSKVLDRSIEWGDYQFQVGGNVSSRFEFQIFEAAYEYAFMRQPNYELAASIGVHYTDITLQLSGNAIVTDANGNTRNVAAATKSSSLPAPLPMIGLRGAWAVAPNWVLDAQAQFLKVKVNEYDGSWSDLRLNATWMFSRNYGVGMGYNWFRTKVDVEKTEFQGQVKTGYSGLQAYLTGTF